LEKAHEKKIVLMTQGHDPVLHLIGQGHKVLFFCANLAALALKQSSRDPEQHGDQIYTPRACLLQPEGIHPTSKL
jgi:hypothetical protein